MQGKIISRIIILGTIALIGMLIVQSIWLSRSLDSRKRQFTQNVQAALRATSEAIISSNEANSKQMHPVEQLSSNYFVVMINGAIQPETLKTLLIRELTLRNVNLDFEFSIYDCSNEKLVFGNYISNEAKQKLGTEFPEINKDDYYFSVLFPSISFQLIQEMQIWVISIIILLIIVIIFSYTVYALFKQKRLSEIQKDFINNMTHEFKTPLTAISVCAEVISDKNILNDQERLWQYTSIIHKEAERLAGHVQKLLQASKIEQKVVQLNISEVEVSSLINECIEQLKPVFEKAGGRVTFTENLKGLKLRTDAFHLGNMIYNLLDNAIKYGGDPALIEINSATNGNEVQISISDNGGGILKKQQQNIFERFFRVTSGDIHDVKGFGLGLFYVKQMSKVLKGDVFIQKSDESGSIFILKLANYE
ncbi:HAMP domain-containing histidine kinase [Marivirga sp. S37H4]|uniref:histidine kinase n=1 Tax=Marivirga aurantiaca TaxID=2802615 RepID=A0A934WZ60_9BACT|nr:HAMP domain-containing sensor histidine kinase [Marivirga aurantiaca]MBK6265537.1 HAMP domain-containing histidine kinase [Marivirga aurantiaca]